VIEGNRISYLGNFEKSGFGCNTSYAS